MSKRRRGGFLSWCLRLLGIVVLVALGAAAGVGLYEAQTSSYTSSADVLIQPRDYSQLVLGQSFAGTDPARQLMTARVAAQSTNFERAVADQLQLPVSTVHKHLTTTVVDGANVLAFTATSSTVDGSQTLAATAAKEITSFYEKTLLDGLGAAATTANPDLAKKIAQAQAYEKANPSVSVLSDASVPASTTRTLQASVELGALAGLVIGMLLLAWLLRTRPAAAISADPAPERLDPRVIERGPAWSARERSEQL